MVFRGMSEEKKANLSGTSKFTINLGSGVIAGFAAAILSQVCLIPLIFAVLCSFVVC